MTCYFMIHYFVLYSLVALGKSAKPCGKMEPPENGLVSYIDDGFVLITCNSGFQLLNSKYRKCLDSGKWGGPRRFCIRGN